MYPYSEDYHIALVKDLKLDTELYAHVDPKLLFEFKALLCKYPTAFWLPGNPLTEVGGFEHIYINTDNSLPFCKHPYRKSPAELHTIKQIQSMLILKIIDPIDSQQRAACILV